MVSTLIPRAGGRPGLNLLEATGARPLYEIAHCRAGDKGTLSTLSVSGRVVRFELPCIAALQFVCEGILGGGVTISLALDAHAKSLSSRLLAVEIYR